MDSDQGKLFIGGISWEPNEDKLKDHFEIYGEVFQTVITRDKTNGRPRGFGFADPSILDQALQDQHVIDGRTVEAKGALSREEQQTSSRSGNSGYARNSKSGGSYRTKKIFVGGFPPSLDEEVLRQYFETYSNVTDALVMYDQNTLRPHGFGFISFDTEDAVDMVLRKTFHDLSGKQVEVKHALPKDANPGGVAGHSMGGGGSCISFQGYGASGRNSSSYDGRMDSNRHMQSQNGGGLPSHVFLVMVIVQEITVRAMAVTVVPILGMVGPLVIPTETQISSILVMEVVHDTWSSQAPSGYGAVEYGNSGSKGIDVAPISQSPSGASGYGKQGYGGYGGNEGSYANQGAYDGIGGHAWSVPNSNAPAAGGDLQGNGGGYMGGSYGDANRNGGYGQGWGSDSSQTFGNYRA